MAPISIAASPVAVDRSEPDRRALRQALFERVRPYAIPFRIRQSERGLLAAFEMGQVCCQVRDQNLHDPEIRWDLFCAGELGYGYVQIRKFADIAVAFQRIWIDEAPQGRLIEMAAVIARGAAALPEDVRLLLWDAAQARSSKAQVERVRAAVVSHLRARPQATKDEVRALIEEVRSRGPDADELLKEGRRALLRVDKIRRQMAAAGFADAMALLDGRMGLGLSSPVSPPAPDPDPPPGPDRRAITREVDGEVEPISVTETPAPPLSPPSDAPPAVVKPPRRRGPDEHFLPIPYPTGNDHPTEAERHAVSLVILLFQINRLIPTLLRLWDERQPMAHMLQYRSIRILLDYLDIREAIAPCARRGAAEPGDDQLPVCTADDPPRPMLYLTLLVVDPEGDPDPTESERMMWILLALIACCRRTLLQYGERFAAGDALDPALQHQLAAALWDNVAPVGMMITNLRKGAVLGQAESEAADAAAEERQQEATAHTVTGGTDRPSGAWTVVGMTASGHHVAVDKATGQVLILVGTPGTGKTQFGVNLAEGLVLLPEGLSSGDRPGCAFVFTTDFRRGAGNHQHFCGLSQNPYADQRRYLREYYGVREVQNAAYDRVIAYVQPGTLLAYQDRYPDLCERGLEFREIFFHPSEQGSFFYKLMLPGGEQSGKGRSQWRMHLDNCIAHRGLGGDPALLLQDFLRARLTGANQAAVQAQFQVIQKMTSTQQRMISALCEPGFSVFLLESVSLGGDILVPMELAIMNVLSQETAVDPYRMFILHEFGKQGTSEQVGPFLKELFGEVRHRPCTYVVETHHIGDLPAGLAPLATGLVHFAGTSQQDFRRVQELFYPYQGVPFSAIAGQQRGQGHIAFRVATDRRFTEVAQPFLQRPSLIWAGGETVAR